MTGSLPVFVRCIVGLAAGRDDGGAGEAAGGLFTGLGLKPGGGCIGVSVALWSCSVSSSGDFRSDLPGKTVVAVDGAGLGALSRRAISGICAGNDVRAVGVDGRRFGRGVVSGESERLKGDDLCAPKDSGLGFLGDVDRRPAMIGG